MTRYSHELQPVVELNITAGGSAGNVQLKKDGFERLLEASLRQVLPDGAESNALRMAVDKGIPLLVVNIVAQGQYGQVVIH